MGDLSNLVYLFLIYGIAIGVCVVVGCALVGFGGYELVMWLMHHVSLK